MITEDHKSPYTEMGMQTYKAIDAALRERATPEKATAQMRFFKTGSGQYGEGDVFLGVSVPEQRAIAKRFWKETSLHDIQALLSRTVHEYRLTALFILVLKFQKSREEEERDSIIRCYLANLDFVNNWDLVDSSAHYLLGSWLLEHPAEISLIDTLAASGQLWRERISIMTTFAFIKADRFEPTLRLAEKFLSHPHDLIHKAAGWMLREIGNRNQAIEIRFLEQFHTVMPRTMLRYAIEKFPEAERKHWLHQS